MCLQHAFPIAHLFSISVLTKMSMFLHDKYKDLLVIIVLGHVKHFMTKVFSTYFKNIFALLHLKVVCITSSQNSFVQGMVKF
jgi:hypothetical protein